VLRRLGRAGRYREAGRVAELGFVAAVGLALEVVAGTSFCCTGTGGIAMGDVGTSTLCAGTGSSTMGEAGASTLCIGTGSPTLGLWGGIGTGAGAVDMRRDELEIYIVFLECLLEFGGAFVVKDVDLGCVTIDL
jgi:hypothetical protein